MPPTRLPEDGRRPESKASCRSGWFHRPSPHAHLRIVAMADTHLQHDGLVVPDGDVLVHAGDMLQHGSLDELARAADFLRGAPASDQDHRRGQPRGLPREATRRGARAARRLRLSRGRGRASSRGSSSTGAPGSRSSASGPSARRAAPSSRRSGRRSRSTSTCSSRTDRRTASVIAFAWKRSGAPRRLRGSSSRACARCEPKLHLFGHIHQDRGLWSERRDDVRERHDRRRRVAGDGADLSRVVPRTSERDLGRGGRLGGRGEVDARLERGARGLVHDGAADLAELRVVVLHGLVVLLARAEDAVLGALELLHQSP